MVKLVVSCESSLGAEVWGQICPRLLESVELGPLGLFVFSPVPHHLAWCSLKGPNMNVLFVTYAYKEGSVTEHVGDSARLTRYKMPLRNSDSGPA